MPESAEAAVELFRLAALRAPERGLPPLPRIVLQPNARVAATTPSSPPSGRDGTGTGNPGGGTTPPPTPATPLSLTGLDAALLAADDAMTPKAVADWVKAATGQKLETLVATEDYRTLRRASHQALLGALVPAAADGRTLAASAGVAQTREESLRAVRLLGLLDVLADPATAASLADAADVRRFLRFSVVVLPDDVPRPADNLARPPAIADLKVVRLGQARYVPGAIAHVENVMGREKRERVHEVTEQTETTTVVETERTVENESELETASRTELLQEANRALREATDLEAGVSVSAAYGPTVQVEADTRVARHASAEEVTRAAATFTNSVTKRARERIVERTRETRTVRRLLEIKESNTHAFDNTGGAEHIRGVYRWVESVQDAWIEDYGKRLMLEYVVPEPAAFLRWAAEANRPASDVGDPPEAPSKPGEPGVPLEPGHVDADNYLALVARYGATGVAPPPADSVELALSWKGEPDQDLHLFNESSALKVPKGYHANAWEAQCVTWGKKSPDGEVWMAGVGATGGIGEDNSGALKKHLSGTLDAAEDSVIPVVMLGRGLINLSTALRVHCRLTQAGRERWQLAVYEAVMAAYRERLEAYEARVARAEAAQAFAAPAALDGSNAAENSLVERRELRRSVIHMLLGASPDTGVFGGEAVVHDPAGGAPRLDLTVAAAERDVLAFVEQAFEWPNMTWVHYPYYWATREQWAKDCRASGPDPAWTAFLTAGASRVVVPVRPGFEAAVALYLATGIIWAGGQVPTVGDPAYLAIADEIAESLGTRTSATAPVRTPLEPVRLPTSLVWLQPSGNLDPVA